MAESPGLLKTNTTNFQDNTLGWEDLEPRIHRGLDHVGSDLFHAAMIGGTAAEEARAAIGLLLDDGKTWRDRGGAFGIGGTEDGDDRKADGGGYVHGAGIVAEEEVALGKKRGEIGDDGFAGEIDRGALQFGGDGGGDWEFARSAEEDDVSVGVGEQRV